MLPPAPVVRTSLGSSGTCDGGSGDRTACHPGCWTGAVHAPATVPSEAGTPDWRARSRGCTSPAGDFVQRPVPLARPDQSERRPHRPPVSSATSWRFAAAAAEARGSEEKVSLTPATIAPAAGMRYRGHAAAAPAGRTGAVYRQVSCPGQGAEREVQFSYDLQPRCPRRVWSGRPRRA